MMPISSSTFKRATTVKLTGWKQKQQSPSDGGSDKKTHLRYEVERYVPGGECGAYGEVFEARDTRTNTKVAIKRICSAIDSNEQFPISVLREAACLRTLDHVNVLSLHDLYIHEQRLNFVFELMSCNLRHYINECFDNNEVEKWMPEDACNSFSRQILSAVAHCHDRNIIHRDLKPDNILLDSTRQHVKVADFGMACVIHKKGEAHTDRTVSAWYRPPEIMMGNRFYDSSIDLWSCGCILVEMMTLHPIFPCVCEWECLLNIFRWLGTPDEQSWPGVSRFPGFIQFPQWQPGPTIDCLALGAPNSPYPSNELALDLCRRLLQLNPAQRITAADAVALHPYFGSPQTHLS